MVKRHDGVMVWGQSERELVAGTDAVTNEPEPAVCIFCGRGPVTLEHVLPKWLKDVLPIKGPVDVYVGAEGGAPSWTMASLDQKARIVCRGCNNGWMSDLEAFCRPRMASAMAQATSVSLAPTEQERVAAWAVKTALTLHAGFPALRDLGQLPADHLHWMPAWKTTPPPGSFVWLFRALPFARGGRRFRGAWVRMAGIGLGDAQRIGDPEHPNAYLATFTVGHLGLQVFGRDRPADGLIRRVDPGAYWRGALVEIWPPNLVGAIWPPPRVLTPIERELLSRWGQHVW